MGEDVTYVISSSIGRLRFHGNIIVGVIIVPMASQITSLTIVYSTICSRYRSKETSKLRVTGLCEENSPVTGEFPAHMASNAENVSIWWRHHEIQKIDPDVLVTPQVVVSLSALIRVNILALYPLRWRHNGHDSVSDHQPRDGLLNRLFRRRSKKTSKLRVTGLCAGNSPGTGEFPAQMASNAENVSIWWRHHALYALIGLKHIRYDKVRGI